MTRPWRVLGAVAFANLLVAMLHFGLAAAGPLLRREFDLDTAELGLLLAAPPLGLMLGTFLWGELSDRLEERLVLAGAFAGFAGSVAGAAWGAARSDPMALGIALLASGAFGSAAHSAGGRAISAAFPPRRHGFVLAIRHTAIPIGGALGGIVVPATARSSGFVPVLVGIALGGLLAAAIVALVLPRSLRIGDLVEHDAPERAASARQASPLRDPRMWLLCIGCGSLAFVQLGIGSFLTVQLVDEAGFALGPAAAVFTGAQLAGAAGRIVFGVLSDRVGRRVGVLRWIAVAAGATMLPTVLGLGARVDAILFVAALVVVTSCNGVAVAAAARLAPTGRTGATLGMQTTANAAACTIAPVVLGALLHVGGWAAFAWAILGVLAVSVASLTVLLRAAPE